MPVPKGYRRPVEILRLVVCEEVTLDHVKALSIAEKLRQTVTVKLVAGTIVFAARPT